MSFLKISPLVNVTSGGKVKSVKLTPPSYVFQIGMVSVRSGSLFSQTVTLSVMPSSTVYRCESNATQTGTGGRVSTFRSVKAEAAGAVVFRSSLKISVSVLVVLTTIADSRVGFAVSTLWSGKASCAACARAAFTCSAGSVRINLIVPPLRLSELAHQETPSWSSPSVPATAYEKTRSFESEPLAYAAWRVATPRVSLSTIVIRTRCVETSITVVCPRVESRYTTNFSSVGS